MQLAAEGQQRRARLKEEPSSVLNSSWLPKGIPPARCPVHHIELASGASPSFVPSYLWFSHREVNRAEREPAAKSGMVQLPTIAFGDNPLLAKQKDGRWPI